MKMQPEKKRGFTLIELMIVIIILGVLVALATGSFVSSQKKSRDSKRKNDIRQVALALEAYVNDKGRYPPAGSNGEIAGCAPDDQTICPWGEIFQDQNGTTYMVELPEDGIATQRYYYLTDAAGTWYQLYVRLENVLDKDIPTNPLDESQTRVFTDLACSSDSDVYCNYGVASTNKTVEEGRTVSYE